MMRDAAMRFMPLFASAPLRAFIQRRDVYAPYAQPVRYVIDKRYYAIAASVTLCLPCRFIMPLASSMMPTLPSAATLRHCRCLMLYAYHLPPAAVA